MRKKGYIREFFYALTGTVGFAPVVEELGDGTKIVYLGGDVFRINPGGTREKLVRGVIGAREQWGKCGDDK